MVRQLLLPGRLLLDAKTRKTLSHKPKQGDASTDSYWMGRCSPIMIATRKRSPLIGCGQIKSLGKTFSNHNSSNEMLSFTDCYILDKRTREDVPP